MKLRAKPQYTTGKCEADWVEMEVEGPRLTILLCQPLRHHHRILNTQNTVKNHKARWHAFGLQFCTLTRLCGLLSLHL